MTGAVPGGDPPGRRDAVTINLDQLGGRALREGVLPVRCLERRP
jgi:hypothetical protein